MKSIPYLIVLLSWFIVSCDTYQTAEITLPEARPCVYNWTFDHIENWEEFYFDMPHTHLISFPSSYRAYSSEWGTDTWVFQAWREDSKVIFSGEKEWDLTYQPYILEAPFPDSYALNEHLTYDDHIQIPSRNETELDLGILYYNCDNGSDYQNTDAAFFLRIGNKYYHTFFIRAYSSELKEVMEILSTIRKE